MLELAELESPLRSLRWLVTGIHSIASGSPSILTSFFYMLLEIFYLAHLLSKIFHMLSRNLSKSHLRIASGCLSNVFTNQLLNDRKASHKLSRAGDVET